MPKCRKFIIKYFDIIDAEDIEQAKDILLKQLSMDVKNEDAMAFDIEEYIE